MFVFKIQKMSFQMILLQAHWLLVKCFFRAWSFEKKYYEILSPSLQMVLTCLKTCQWRHITIWFNFKIQISRGFTLFSITTLYFLKLQISFSFYFLSISAISSGNLQTYGTWHQEKVSDSSFPVKAGKIFLNL